MRLAWLTDIHLDHLKPRREARRAFAELVANSADACVITGDCSSATEAHLLGDFADDNGKPVYFVLGNHDYWGSSFGGAEEHVRKLCAARSNLHWLTESGPIDIAPGVQLCGVDGWYDAEFGNWRSSDFIMVDWKKITDLRKIFQVMAGEHLVKACRERAQMFAIKAREQLSKATAKRVFFATHMPPFEQSAMHEGRPSTPQALPWYTSRAMGYALMIHADKHRDQEFTTLCGHVHSASEYIEGPNHTVLCGAAEYGRPEIVRVFDL